MRARHGWALPLVAVGAIFLGACTSVTVTYSEPTSQEGGGTTTAEAIAEPTLAFFWRLASVQLERPTIAPALLSVDPREPSDTLDALGVGFGLFRDELATSAGVRPAVLFLSKGDDPAAAAWDRGLTLAVAPGSPPPAFLSGPEVDTLVIFAPVASSAVAAGAGLATTGVRLTSFAGQGETRELTVTVGTGAEPRQFVVRGPSNLLDLDEKAKAQVVGEHLLVYTRAVISIFDLESGEQVLDQVAAPEVVALSDGELVAFEALQRRFTPPEASSSVVEAVDVRSLAVEPVFPERSVIRPAQFGGLLAWIEDPLERHSAGKLVFSPDGEQVAFFCTHIPASPDGLQRVFLVVIDLSKGLAESRFVHVPFDWTANLEPDVETVDRKPFFAIESVEWTEDGTLLVRPPKYARWLDGEIVVPLPGAEAWATEAHASGSSSAPNEDQP